MSQDTDADSNEFADAADLRVSMGCVAEHATECTDVWVHIATVWAVAESLNDTALRAREQATAPADDAGVSYVNRGPEYDQEAV